MGEFASDVQAYLCGGLADRVPDGDWQTEYPIAGTAADIAGERGPRLYLVELEWRRADPVDNTAKLFRHLASGALGSSEVVVFQVFSDYYDLERGGVSSRRKDAEFVGRVAADTEGGFSYVPLDFGLDPPKRGGSRPPDWEAVADDVVAEIARYID